MIYRKIYLFIFLVLSAPLNGCVLRNFTQKNVDSASTDRILYKMVKPNEISPFPFVVYKNGVEIGQLREVFKPYRIEYVTSAGQHFRLWRDFDYSGIFKFTQSLDEKIIRIYHWHILIFSREYVTEFNLETHKRKHYLLGSKHSQWPK